MLANWDTLLASSTVTEYHTQSNNDFDLISTYPDNVNRHVRLQVWQVPGAVAESVEHMSRVREIMGSNQWSSPINTYKIDTIAS